MARVFDWLGAHHEALAVLVSLGTLLVWVTYLQAFLASYRRQHTGTLLITLGQGRGLEAHCLVTNMSAEPVYVLSLIARVESDACVRSRAITELEGEPWKEPSDLRLWTRQGPLDSGGLRDMGTFDDIVDHVLAAGRATGRDADGRAIGLRRVVVQVIAVHGAEDLPVGAERAFEIVGNGPGLVLRPQSAGARQIRSRRERRQLLRLLEQDLDAPLDR